MFSEVSIFDLKLLTAVALLIGAACYAIFRMRQAATGGDILKLSREEIKKRNARRCPHYTEKEIRSAKKVYVRPDCAQVDPSNEVEFRKFASVREQIFKSVSRYKDAENRRHLLILADSGMGKTTFCLNVFDTYEKRTKRT